MNVPRTRIAVGLTVVALAVGTTVAARSAFARGNAAPGRQSATGNLIHVQGHGEVSVAPDQATLNLGVETRSQDAQDALSKNSTQMNAVIAAIKAQGIPAKNIQTSGLSIWRDDQKDQYVVSHQVTAKILNVNIVGGVLDAAVAAGANNSWGVSFGLQDQSAAEAEALQTAVKNARKHADSIAGALGVGIVGVRSASQPAYTGGPIAYSTDARAGAAAPSVPTQIQTGQLTITADVTVDYAFG